MPRGTNTGKAWPRPYVLEIFQQAVQHGFIWIGPISAADAASLKMALVRARRRADTSNRDYILPEYHLISSGEYDPARQRFAVLYSRLPDNEPLPGITPATAAEQTQPTTTLKLPAKIPEPSHTSLLSVQALTPEAMEIKPEEIGGFVERMKRAAQRKAEDHS